MALGDDGDLITVGSLEIRPSDGLVRVRGRTVLVSMREFQLLMALSRQVGRIVSRPELYRTVWGKPMRPDDRSVDVYIRKLRVKLEEANPDEDLIHTHVRFGYRIQAERSQNGHESATSA